MRSLDYVDQKRIAVSAHSLGAIPAIALTLLCDDIRALIVNDFMCDEMKRYYAITEEPENQMQNIGLWHIVPGMGRYFRTADLCAACAPRYLAANEGGPDEMLDVLRHGYAAAGAEDRLQITHYPKYQDPASRTHEGPVPDHGLSEPEFYDWCYCDASDHSFRRDPSLRLLKKCFGL